MNKKCRRIMTAVMSYILVLALVLSNVATVFASEETQTEIEVVETAEILDDVETEEETVEGEIAEDEIVEDKVTDEAEAEDEEKSEEEVRESKEASVAQAVQAKVDAVSSATTVEDNDAKQYTLEEGTYDVDAAFWHETDEKLSGADDALTGVQLKAAADGTVKVYLSLQEVQSQWLVNYKEFKYEDGAGNFVDVAVEEGTEDEPRLISFTLPSNVAFTKMKTAYPNAFIPSEDGYHRISIRLHIDWDSAVKVKDDDNNDAKEYTLEEGTYDVDAAFWHETEEKLSGADDALTGVQLKAAADGTVKVYLSLQEVQSQWLVNYKEFKYEDGAGNFVDAAVEEGTEDEPRLISFTLPSNVAFTNMKTAYPNAFIPSEDGYHRIAIRLHIDWDSAVKSEGNDGDDDNSTEEKLEDGTYDIDAKFQKDDGTASMADQALDSAYLVVKNSEITLYLNMAEMMGTYVNEITCEGTAAVAEAKDANGNITCFSLSVLQGTESMKVTFSAAGMPVAQSANLVLDWNSVKVKEEDNNEDNDTKEYTLEEGTYNVDAAFWHETEEKKSGADDALTGVQLKAAADGTVKVYLSLQEVEAQWLVNYKEFKYEDGAGNFADAAVEEGTEDEPRLISFTLPSNVAFTKMKTAYPNAFVPSEDGYHRIAIRLHIDWDSAVKIEDNGGDDNGDDDNGTEEKLADGTYDIDAKFQKDDGTASMADQALDSAYLVVKNSKITLYLNMAEMMGTYVDGITYDDGTEAVAETKDANGNITCFSLNVVQGTESMKVSFTAAGMPAAQSANLVLDWNSVKVKDGNGGDGDDGNNGDDDKGTEGKLENGTYKINAKIFNASEDKDSMADEALKQAYIVAKNEKYTLYLKMGSIQNVYLDELTYDSGSGNYKKATVVAADANNNITGFTMPATYGTSIIPVKFTFDMGTVMTQPARISLDWDSAVKTDESLSLKEITLGSGSGNGDGNGSGDNGGDGSGDGSGDETLDKDNLKDGIYEVEIDLWNASSDQASMASDSMNKIARIEVKDSNYKMYVYTKTMTVGSITANLQRMQVENSSGGYSQAAVAASDSSGTPTAFSFTMPHTNEYIKVKVDPQVEIMGNDYIDARLKISWSTLKAASSDTNLTSSPDDSTVGSSSSSSSAKKSVKTGDETELAVLLAMLLISAAFAMYYMCKRARNAQ